jgi:hypothetical protein
MIGRVSGGVGEGVLSAGASGPDTGATRVEKLIFTSYGATHAAF